MESPHRFLALPESLFETSAVADYTGKIELPELTMGADVYRFADPLDYHLLITNTGGALLVSGSVSGLAETSCARCLDTMQLPLDAEVEGYFVLPGKDAPLTDDEEAEYDTLEEGNKIDLDALARAALALTVPYIPLCKDDCVGLCPQCGTNLNHGSCDCAAEEPLAANNPFAVLKDYPFAASDDAGK